MAEDDTFDLWYDPNEVDGDMVVRCWIAQSRRAADPSFDPQPGDGLLVRDMDEPPLRARVIRRDGDWVSVRLPPPGSPDSR